MLMLTRRPNAGDQSAYSHGAYVIASTRDTF